MSDSHGGGGGRGGGYIPLEHSKASNKIATLSSAECEYYNQADHEHTIGLDVSPSVQVERLGLQLLNSSTNGATTVSNYLSKLFNCGNSGNCGQREYLIKSNNFNESRFAFARGKQLATSNASSSSSCYYYYSGSNDYKNSNNKTNIKSNNYYGSQTNMRGILNEKNLNIRYIGVVLFIVASIFCLYKIYQLNHEASDAHKRSLTIHLKLVSVFNRHGDRSPSDKLPIDDKHNSKRDFFWPNGMGNLTDLGTAREYRIGLELRRLYGKHLFLDFNSSHVLAFSSAIYRCQDSLENTLRGLFDIEQTTSFGRKLIDRYNEQQNKNGKVQYCFNNNDEIVHNETYCSQELAQQQQHHDHHHQQQQQHDEHEKLKGKTDKRREFWLPSGSGSPSEYKNIQIDIRTVPTLTYLYLDVCKYRLDNPTPVDDNLLHSPAIAQVKGVNKLVKLLNNRYKMNFNFTVLGHWSTVSNELRLARTKESIKYCDHFADWINLNVPEYTQAQVSLFDLFEYVAVLGYRDRIVGKADLIQLGPMVTSLIKSQSIALSQSQDNLVKLTGSNAINAQQELRAANDKGRVANMNTVKVIDNNLRQRVGEFPSIELGETKKQKTFADGEQYKDKKIIIYSTHDSILQLLMHRLGIIRMEPASYEARFKKWQHSNDFDQYLAGLRMSRFGASLVFELHESLLEQDGHNSDDALPQPPGEINPTRQTKRFAFVKAVLYNQDDAKYKPVEYKQLKIGSICRRRFQEMHKEMPKAEVSLLLDRYYDTDFPLDKKISCPYELFKQITSNYMIEPDELSKLCDK